MVAKVMGILQNPQPANENEASVLLRQGLEPFRKRLREVMGPPS